MRRLQCMAVRDGPRNAASELAELLIPLLSFLSVMSDDELAVVVGDAVIEDRRRLVVHRSYSARDALSGILELEDLGGGGSVWRVDEVIAVRGERAAIVCVRFELTDGSEFEYLELRLHGPDMRVLTSVIFDSDASDAATARLDAWHDENSERGDRVAAERMKEELLEVRAGLRGRGIDTSGVGNLRS